DAQDARAPASRGRALAKRVTARNPRRRERGRRGRAAPWILADGKWSRRARCAACETGEAVASERMSDRARHVASFAVLAVFLGLNTATSKPHGGYSGPTTTPATTDAALAKSPADAAPPTVPDVDTAAVT